MKFSEISVKRDDEREHINELIDYQGFCAGPKTNKNEQAKLEPAESNGRTMDEVEMYEHKSATEQFQTISPNDCLCKLTNGWTPWVLDVRLQTENDIVALPFTDRVSPHRTVSVRDVPVTGDILVYCKAGVRGKKAIHRLIELGVDGNRLYNLDGGIMRWQNDVDNSMPRY